MTSELNQLKSDEEDLDKKEILEQLKPFCKFVYEKYNRCYGKTYKKLQTTKEWKEARLLIRDFLKENGKSICATCKEEITGSFVLHHSLYPSCSYNIFNPMYCEIVHNNGICHKKGNPQKW